MIQGITFADEHVFTPKDGTRPILQLGQAYYSLDRGTADEDARVEDVTITGNVFDKTFGAIVDGGLPIRGLFITHNELGDYHVGLQLGGNRYNSIWPYRLDDSVIAYNTFKPGSFMDVPGRQGALVWEIGASRRLDASHNVADGAASDYLNSPHDPKGWGSGFFWHMAGSHEMLLVAANRATCTGDKAGDGPAIAYDGNVNTYAFDSARVALGATPATVTVAGPMKSRQDNADIDIGRYYIGHWVQIAAGPGVGQVRKITAYRIEPVTERVTFDVAPAWDVAPQAGISRITVGRQYWQVYTVGNIVDHRRPLCLKSNRGGRPKGGEITLWAQTADSAVEGNQQYDTDGITLQQGYSAEDPACPSCAAWTAFQSFVAIEHNRVDGEYDWDSACSVSGISGSFGASLTPRSPPPLVSFGVSIAHNVIVHADGFLGGAISFPATWNRGPPPYKWPLVDNVLIHHNELRDIGGRPPHDACGYHQERRVGIRLDGPNSVTRSVLYANTCADVARPLEDHGAGTVRVCPTSAPSSCECESPP